jgi:RimJ/RimL family protein N-acetyltransferase
MSIEIDTGSVRLKQFSTADTRELYCIRNHPSVRQFMSDSRLIPYRSHVRWVSEKLLTDEHFLLLLVRGIDSRRAVGLTQLRVAGDTAEIGEMFPEPHRHQISIVAAAVLTLHLAFEHLSLTWLVSYVLPEHRAAIKLNMSFGAWQEESDKQGMVKLRLDRETSLRNDYYRRLLSRMKGRLRVRIGS